jgi:hypothetical protein
MTDEWIKKMRHLYMYTYTHTIKYYSVTKKYAIMLFADKWMELEIIILSKNKPGQKDKSCMFSLTCGY